MYSRGYLLTTTDFCRGPNVSQANSNYVVRLLIKMDDGLLYVIVCIRYYERHVQLTESKYAALSLFRSIRQDF